MAVFCAELTLGDNFGLHLGRAVDMLISNGRSLTDDAPENDFF